MNNLVKDQGEYAGLLKDLIELDYDAMEAYRVAIDKVGNEEYKVELQKFREDHERHTKVLNAVLTTHGQEMVNKPDLKQWIMKSKVAIGSIIGDNGTILKVMSQVVDSINEAYEKANTCQDIWEDALVPLKQGLMDERRHKEWLNKELQIIMSRCRCT